MKIPGNCFLLWLFSFLSFTGVAVFAEVRVFVEDAGGMAWLKYECTGGEIVRAFPLDVVVDQGEIIEISDFFIGVSTATAQGYGMFPTAFRDHLTVSPDGNVDWAAAAYTPVASSGDNPLGTQPGLGTAGVTLELGGLWDPNDAFTTPPSAGTLCMLQLSEAANVSVTANVARGGLLSATPAPIDDAVFTSAYVSPRPDSPIISEVFVGDGLITIRFSGGDLEATATLPAEAEDWETIGTANGEYEVPLQSGEGARFYRVRGP